MLGKGFSQCCRRKNVVPVEFPRVTHLLQLLIGQGGMKFSIRGRFQVRRNADVFQTILR
jgi:hypothetical protein